MNHDENCSSEASIKIDFQKRAEDTTSEDPRPTVSVIMAAYDSERYIKQSIESVQAQTFTSWELIVVDDCSNDNTSALISNSAAIDSRVRLIKLRVNSGAAAARNRAIIQARGRYLAFLDSDDLWYPHKLKTQLDFMRSVDTSFCYSAYDQIDPAGKSIGTRQVPAKVCYSDLLKSCSVGCLTAIYDTAHYGKILMPDIRKRQDLALWLCLLRHTNSAYGIQEPLAQYRVRKDSLSSNKFLAAKATWHVYRDIENLPFSLSLYFFCHYAVRGLSRALELKLNDRH
jgi:glycosyltransferase involved in cell wall biosynthesis